MKLTYPVKLSAIKHEYDPKWEGLATTMHLELPSGVDLKLLQRIYRRHLKPVNGEDGEYHMVIREQDGGAPRKIRLTGQDTKTKDFALFAIVKKPFSAHDGLEKYLSDSAYDLGEDAPEILFEAELILPESLIVQTIRGIDADLKAEGSSMTITAGGKSVTLGAKDGHDA